MRKTKLIFFLITILCIIKAEAQDAVLPGGGDASGGGGSSSYSIGQIVYMYNSGSSGSSNEGVQQPHEFFTIGIEEDNDIHLSMSVFPNPSNATLSLNIENMEKENLFVQLVDVTGKELLSQAIKNPVTVIPMQAFAAGTYYLKVFNTKSTLKSFNIIKN